ncbi:type VI secretion system tip protein VgrG [Parashewanella spongiae]|uniref:Type VI secretion system tip protein VgrG n=1 Tax=Parashewanella spongiae TaxID=342950 RepID=A0A3A6UBA1_9GAMM|nr:type VI secretion system tip protein TssI/VgrG [Parashewanella spongiae]MCL1076802.1 type VI secretion system tip protein VgrG [Parashewanella spongiae]RJY19274.1 type VI secretion system tip protein VgrG [Parashewanella spongiae]
MKYSSKTRNLTIMVDGTGPYICSYFKATQTISEKYIQTSVFSSDEYIASDIVGAEVIVEYADMQTADIRTFKALISEFTLLSYSKESEQYTYRVVSVDPIHFLSLSRTHAVYQSLSTKKIVEDVFDKTGLKKFVKFSISSPGKEHEYCAVINETYAEFVKRLLAEEGWFYFLTHDEQNPTLIIADSSSAYINAKQENISFVDKTGSYDGFIDNLSYIACAGTSSVMLADHTQELADVFQSSAKESALNQKLKSLPLYRFGQGFKDKSEAKDATKIWMESLDAERVCCEVSSKLYSLSCCSTFKLKNHPVSDLNKEFVVLDITHEISPEEKSSVMVYKNEYRCIVKSTPFRPKIVSKPLISGLHCATVTGPSKEEIYTEKLRVKVQFHWDTDGKNDENTSCWLPVAQGFASNGFGLSFLPRIGDEVLVQYINGNPDQPVVIGSIYNEKNIPVYDVPTQTGFKSRTSKEGSSAQSNEVRFEDKKDSEEIFMHSQGLLTLEVEKDASTTIKGAQKTQIEKTLECTVKEQITINTEKDFGAEAKGALQLKSDKDTTAESGNNMGLKAKSKIEIDGQTLSLNGKTKIELVVGSCKIALSSSGINIEAPKIVIKGQAKTEISAAQVAVEGQTKVDLKGAIVSVEGSAITKVKAGAMVEIQGGIAKIN